MHLRRILVPTDLSESSVDGIKYALFLAEWEGAEAERIPVATLPEYLV